MPRRGILLLFPRTLLSSQNLASSKVWSADYSCRCTWKSNHDIHQHHDCLRLIFPAESKVLSHPLCAICHRRPEDRKSRTEVLDRHFETSSLGWESSVVECSTACAICRTLDAKELRAFTLLSLHASVQAYYC